MTIFVSHASEDKTDFVRPLAHALKKFGLQIWYDEFSLRPGDSLRRSIDKGLVECSVGLVVLSHNFFLKQWPQIELDALFSAAIDGSKQLVPVWLNITKLEIARVSPLLADRIAILSEIGIEQVAVQVAALVPRQTRYSGESLAKRIERFQDISLFSTEGQLKGCQYRFLQIQALHSEYAEIRDSTYATEPESATAEDMDATDTTLDSASKSLFDKYDIPDGVYLVPDSPEPEENFGPWMESLCHWTSGTMTPKECRKLLSDLDEYLDIDYLYVLFGIPNFYIFGAQRHLLDDAVVAVGSWMIDDKAMYSICQSLRELDADA